MIKNTLLALVAVAALGGAAAPAFADTNSVFGTGDFSDRQAVAATVKQELQRAGINATSVDEWNGYVRAFVTQADGTQVQQFFDAVTLAPVAL